MNIAVKLLPSLNSIARDKHVNQCFHNLGENVFKLFKMFVIKVHKVISIKIIIKFNEFIETKFR
jgi:hypothetical protein